MAEARRNIFVGLFVLIGLAFLGTLIILFGRGPTWLMRGDTYPLTIHFETVKGIRQGNLVTARGMTIGRVVDVRLTDPQRFESGVDVDIAVDQEYRVPSGSRAQTVEPVLGQGRPPIEIVAGPGGEGFLPPGAVISGTTISAVDSIFPSGVVTTFQVAARQIGDAAASLTPVLDELQTLLEQRDPGRVDEIGGLQGNLSSAVARLDTLLRNVNEVVGDAQTQSQLREAVANLHDMSERGTRVMASIEQTVSDGRDMIGDARQFIGKADQTLTTVDGQVRDLSKATQGTLNRFDSVLDSLNVITARVRDGEGTVGRLLTDNKLYDALVISMEKLTMALDDARMLITEWRQGKVRVAF